MALKFKFKSKDEIPAELAGHYVERDGAWVLDGLITHANKPASTGIGLDGGGCGCDYFFAVALDMDDLASALVALAAGVLHQRSTQS